MSEQVSLVRLYLLRGAYLFIFVFVGSAAWFGLVVRDHEPLPGLAVSFWAALAAVAGLGVRYPLAMLPLLFFDVVYKVVWLLAVGLPLGFAGPATPLLSARQLSIAFIGGAVLVLVVIPWPYVVARFVRARGERWTRGHAQTVPSFDPVARSDIRTGSS